MDHCDACRFVYDHLDLEDVPTMLRAQPARYAAALHRAEDAGLERARPRPETWSALEYTCHVRDMMRVQHERLQLALRELRPTFTPMGRDERAIEDRYNDQEVTSVLAELEESATELAEEFEALDAHVWERTAIYTWPETAERSMAWVARHTVHETVHHHKDILDGLGQLRDGS